MDRESGERIGLGVCSEIGMLIEQPGSTNGKTHVQSIVSSPSLRNFRFESNMTLMQHKHFNKLLNDAYNKTQPEKYEVG